MNANGTWAGLSSYVKNGDPVRSALFGSGNQDAKGMIQNVWIGGDKPVYDNNGKKIGTTPMTHFNGMNAVLGRLGFVAAKGLNHKYEVTHYNHFHVDLRVLERKALPDNQEAESTAPDADTPIVALTDLPASYQELLIAAKSELEPQSGSLDMFVDLPPDSPNQAPIVMVAEARQAQKPVTTMRTVGVCEPMANLPDDPNFGEAVIDFEAVTVNYLAKYENIHLAARASKVTLLQPPLHGELTEIVNGAAVYKPARGFFDGQDKIEAVVELGGYQVKVVYFIKVQPEGTGGIPTDDDEVIKKFCGPNGRTWKISITPPALDNATLQSLFKVTNKSVSDASPYLPNSFTVTFGDLAGGAVGQTTGSIITLDLTAAGHGWYIDPTPLDNTDDYLPTSNPAVWQAKAGTDAAGKMDLLSVLLHEYGHALGLDHSSDSGDFMAATLKPGERRLPSAEELQLMSELVAQLKAGDGGEQAPTTPSPLVPSVPLGALLLGRLTLGRRSEEAEQGSQALFAAHPTLQGGGLQNLQDWATQGQVTLASGGAGGQGGATLQESAASQTRLNQVFTINERDRFLSFTLAGTALDDVNGGPDDAFEVALLEADTGRSLTSALSLGHTDALLNLQANGTETAASNVTRVTNPDGSRSYRVDLAGIAAGTAVNLSFDLLGFGQAGSQVTVRDVRVSGLPQLHDDAATLAEDHALAFDPFAQVDNAAMLALGSQVVVAPAHGSVSVNTDGTFVYTPQANYFGTDSFSYRLNDGPLESNLATVNLTVTAVNDAPVVADVQASTAEDSTLVLALGAYASDVDSSSLTVQIVTGPAHGALTQNADGSYSYTPEVNYSGADSFTYQMNDGELASNVATVNLTVTAVNDAPTLGDLSLPAVEDSALPMNLLTAATDVDGDPLTASVVAGPLHGQVSLNADGSFTYVPQANYFGADSFTYQVNDGALDSNVATARECREWGQKGMGSGLALRQKREWGQVLHYDRAEPNG